MARENAVIPLPRFPGQMYFQQAILSQSSPRVNGKLVLQANPLQDLVAQVTMWKPRGNLTCPGANVSNTFDWKPQHYNAVYAKFVGKLRYGSASLGVTLGSWGQARRMIIDRFMKIGKIFNKVEKNVRRKPRLNRKKDLAGAFLEGEFGWVPLLADVVAICSTVCDNAIPDEWIHATKRYVVAEESSATYGGMTTNRIRLSGNARITIAQKVKISNENLWLANRLGLVNPLTVAWDLVPWSFVVNMFLNVNQIVGALSDTVGLELTDGSVTRSSRILREEVSWVPFDYTDASGSYLRGDDYAINVNTRQKTRVLGAPPMPSLQFKLPNVNFELAAIASALVTQRVSKL